MSRIIPKDKLDKREMVGTNDTLEAAVQRTFKAQADSLQEVMGALRMAAASGNVPLQLVQGMAACMEMVGTLHHLELDTRRLMNEGRIYDIIDTCLDQRMAHNRQALDEAVAALGALKKAAEGLRDVEVCDDCAAHLEDVRTTIDEALKEAAA